MSDEKKELTQEEKDKIMQDALERHFMGFRKGRRFLGRTFESSISDKKCFRCDNTVGVVSLGQEKNYCNKSCRRSRHGSKV